MELVEAEQGGELSAEADFVFVVEAGGAEQAGGVDELAAFVHVVEDGEVDQVGDAEELASSWEVGAHCHLPFYHLLGKCGSLPQGVQQYLRALW